MQNIQDKINALTDEQIYKGFGLQNREIDRLRQIVVKIFLQYNANSDGTYVYWIKYYETSRTYEVY